MADKLMFVPNDDTQNYHFCRFKLMVKNLSVKMFQPLILIYRGVILCTLL